MSPYAFGGLLLTFVAWSGGMYYMGHSNEAGLCKAADEQADILAYKHKDIVQTSQTSINQSGVKAYEKDFNAIGTLYSSGLPAASVSNLPVISSTTSGTKPQSCVSKKYKLTPQQCDVTKAKALALWDDWIAQAAVK